MRKTYIWDKQRKEFVDYYAPERVQTHVVMQDSIEPTKHPADGRVYESKSQYNQVTRSRGLVEIGPEGLKAMLKRDPHEIRPVKETIREAVQKVNQGYRPAPLERSDFSKFYNE